MLWQILCLLLIIIIVIINFYSTKNKLSCSLLHNLYNYDHTYIIKKFWIDISHQSYNLLVNTKQSEEWIDYIRNIALNKIEWKGYRPYAYAWCKLSLDGISPGCRDFDCCELLMIRLIYSNLLNLLIIICPKNPFQFRII